jgi:alkyl sulfatase BDS1-like metallo-beta-lactamase superfamily hydrolase
MKASIPTEYLPPDLVYRDRMTARVGGVEMVLRHTRGETEDHSWIFFPDNGVLCTGDLFIWAVPNAGNPQKTQRYAKEWAVGLREMAGLRPEILAPGHGFPILGKERVKNALEDTADFLESLHIQTLNLMNEYASLDKVIAGVKAPDELLKRPYLQPVYDDTEFIVRNVWRLYGGWYDGIPSHLKPAREHVQAEEIARLAGGADKLASRAEEVMREGDLRLACHLADWAYLAAPDDQDIRNVVYNVYVERAKSEPSTMAMGIFLSVASEMKDEPIQDGPMFYNVINQQAKRGRIIF